MKPPNPSSTTITAVLLLVLLHLTSAAPPPSPSSSCSDELVKFSLCLPYISLSPNNITKTPSTECCDDFASAFSAGNGVCLCYLIQQPLILGFPINSSRLLSLTSLCPVKDEATKANFSLDSLCSGSPTLPPLHSITGPERSRSRPRPRPRPRPPAQSSRPKNSSTPVIRPPEESSNGFFAPAPADDSPTQPKTSSSATMKINKKYRYVLLEFIVFLVHIIREL